MTLLKHVGRLSVAGACLFALVLATSSEVNARPNYKAAFEKAYPELAKKHGKKNEKDKDKLKEALKKVSEVKNKDGKTYGELIKDGKLPGGKDAAN